MSAITRRRSGRIASKPEPTSPAPATYSDEDEDEASSDKEAVGDPPHSAPPSSITNGDSSQSPVSTGTYKGQTVRPRGRPPKKKNKAQPSSIVPSSSLTSYDKKPNTPASSKHSPSIQILSKAGVINGKSIPPLSNGPFTTLPLIHPAPAPRPEGTNLGSPFSSQPTMSSTSSSKRPRPLHPQPLPHQQGMIHLPLGVGSAQYQHFEHAPPPSSSSSSSALPNLDPSLFLGASGGGLDVGVRPSSGPFVSGAPPMGLEIPMGMGVMMGAPEGPFGGHPGGEQEGGLMTLYRDISKILYMDIHQSQGLLNYFVEEIHRNSAAFDRSLPPEAQGPPGRLILAALATSACANIIAVKKVYAGIPGGRSGWENVGTWLVTKAFDVWIGNPLP